MTEDIGLDLNFGDEGEQNLVVKPLPRPLSTGN